MPIYATRYTVGDEKTVRSFIKKGENEAEVKILSDDHLRFLRKRSSEPLTVKGIFEVAGS